MTHSAHRLADLRDPAVLRDFVAAPESDTLERKRTADAATLAKVISAFANTAGGWLLLGVDDDGSLFGWSGKGRAQLRDWLRDVLDNHLDPVPHFDADAFELDGTAIGVVRVPRSAHAPHFVDATGEVFERRNGQTRRAPRDRVTQMGLRDADARERARARLNDRQLALDAALALDAPRESTAMHARALASIVRVSVMEPSQGFCDWVFARDALTMSDEFVRSAAQAMNDRGLDWFDPPRPQPARTTAGGHVAAARWDGRILSEVSVAWDRHGIGGVRFAGSRPDNSGVYYLLSDEARDRWIVTALRYLLTSLEQADAFGPTLARWDLYGIRGADVTTVRDGNIVAAQGVIPPHYNNTVTLDTDIDVGETTAEEAAADLWQQLERLAGAQSY